MAGIEPVSAPGQVHNPCPQVQDSTQRRNSIGLLITLDTDLGESLQENEILEDIKEYLNRAGNVDLDVMENHGNTALMTACMWGKLSIVYFLLEKGADPNISNETRETALHFACSYRKCNPLQRESVNKYLHITCSRHCDKRPKNEEEQKAQEIEEEEATVAMLELLLKYNAIIHLNHEGMSPVDYAALQGKEETVDYILSNVARSKLEELNALEILAFALALQGKCSDAYQVLVKAMKKRHADPDHPITKDNTSESESAFGQKESRTLEELDALKENEHAITVEAILTGDRVLSYRMKSHVYDRVANYGLGLTLNLNTMEQGFSILTGFLQCEQKGLVDVGYVLKFLNVSIQRVSQHRQPRFWISHEIMDQFPNSLCKILKLYVHCLERKSSDSLHKNLTEMVRNLSIFLLHVGQTNRSLKEVLFSCKVLDDLLVPITEMIKIIRSKVPKPVMPENSHILNTVSVSHGLLHHMKSHFTFLPYHSLDEYYCFKHILNHLLCAEGALDVDSSGNTMLHTAVSFPGVIDMIDHRDTPPLHELRVDLIRLLIRHGCPTKTKNKKGDRPDITFMKMLGRYHLDCPDNDIMKQEVNRLLEGPTEVLPLQELTARVILYHRIPYHDKIPPRLKRLIIEPSPEATLRFTPWTGHFF